MLSNQYVSRLALIAVTALLCLMWSDSLAHAEKMKISAKTKLRAKPGEAAKVLRTIKPGRTVRVLRRKGRWVRVRVGKRVGWVTRTTLEPMKGKKARDSDGKWSEKTKKDEQATARFVTIRRKPSNARREPNKRATIVFRMEEGDLAQSQGQSDNGKWLLVENEDGQLGWIRSSRLKTVKDRAAVRARRRARRASGDSVLGRSVRKSRIIVPRVEAALGYRGLGMNFNSNGAALFDQYRIEASSALTQASIWLPFEIVGIVLEVGGSYAFGASRPGIRMPDNMGEISFLTHDAHVGANLGYRFLDGLLTVAGSGGYHYSIFRLDQIDNPAYLPSERLTGVTVGGLVELSPGAGQYAIRGGFRTMLAGTRAQTTGLEDGDISVANAWWAYLDLDYAVWSAFDLVAGYTFERASTSWAGASKRLTGVTAANRTDNNHLLYFGLGRAF